MAGHPGWPPDVNEIETGRKPFATHIRDAAPIIAGAVGEGEDYTVANRARPEDKPTRVRDASSEEVERALAAARVWRETDAGGRAAVLLRAADLYEENPGEILALLARELAKTWPDAVAEVREAVDFLRYYAAGGRGGGRRPRGPLSASRHGIFRWRS